MASAAKALARQQIERRRSERFSSRVTLMVCGQSMGKGSFKEEVATLSINSHGALLPLSTTVALGQKLVLMNPTTWNEVEARVSRLAALDGNGAEVAVEFAEPAPDFWPMAAPPKKAPDSSPPIQAGPITR
jgi:hypothetical protein